jgi:hypothetical protein
MLWIHIGVKAAPDPAFIRSMRIWIQFRIRFQGVDDRLSKLVNFYSKKKQKKIFVPGLHEGRPKLPTGETSTLEKEHQARQYVKLLSLFWVIFVLDQDPNLAHQNQCGSGSTTLLPTPQYPPSKASPPSFLP